MTILIDIFHKGRLEAAGVPLAQAFPGDLEGLARAHADLAATGEHHCGGGAAPHFIARLHDPENIRPAGAFPRAGHGS